MVQWLFTWKRVGGTCFFAKWLCTWSTAFLEKDWNKKEEINSRVIEKCSSTSSLALPYKGRAPSATWVGPLRCSETTTDGNTNMCVWVGSLITSSPQRAVSINFVPYLKLLPCKGTRTSLWRAVCCDLFQAVTLLQQEFLVSASVKHLETILLQKARYK